ncbi:hypothetical protein K443DRAFT_679452, partial [Laccaria amethystina LaAM-08-1]
MTTTQRQTKSETHNVAEDSGLGVKRELDERETEEGTKPTKKPKVEEKETGEQQSVYKSGTIERGHIYFFYRPKVQLEEAHSINGVKNFNILLIPRPPAFATTDENISSSKSVNKTDPSLSEEAEMKVLAPGADAVPAPVTQSTTKQHYRLITVGKKKLPDPEGRGSGSRRKEIFWATVTAVGDDLASLEKGLGGKTYDTKTRGTRHEAASRLAARGAYAIVNTDTEVMSKRETHLGYHISHPKSSEMGNVQSSLGIYSASSFVLQVKNPHAPTTGPRQVRTKGADYPAWIMRDVFGAAAGQGQNERRGREASGLRFASCETPELLEYEGAQLLLIAAREGEQGLEDSLAEGRGVGKILHLATFSF